MKSFLWTVLFLCLVSRGQTTLTVATDGSAQYKTIQDAINAAPTRSAHATIIRIKPGTYKQQLRVPKDKTHLVFRGDDAKTTLLTNDLSAKSKDAKGKEVGTSGSSSTFIDGADFTAENITFENSAGDVGQAVAIKFNSDRGIFRKCRFLGWQDTLYIHDRRAYFVDCHIEGRVDFIFGKSTTVFDHCTIHSKNGGYITAAATPKDAPFGFVFLNCTFTGDGAKAYLGRPWRPDAAVAYINCTLGPHIQPEGWQHWNDTQNPESARFSEFQSIGPGANPKSRVAWSKQLTQEQAKAYTIQNILGSADHWNPTLSAPTLTASPPLH